MHLILA